MFPRSVKAEKIHQTVLKWIEHCSPVTVNAIERFGYKNASSNCDVSSPPNPLLTELFWTTTSCIGGLSRQLGFWDYCRLFLYGLEGNDVWFRGSVWRYESCKVTCPAICCWGAECWYWLWSTFACPPPKWDTSALIVLNEVSCRVFLYGLEGNPVWPRGSEWW